MWVVELIKEKAMLKNTFVLLGVLGLSACSNMMPSFEGGGSSRPITFSKTGEVAGTAGLQVAAEKCAHLEGTKDWQACVAHYDGLYTKSNGTIKRSYVPSSDAPRHTGQIEQCEITATLDSHTGTWSYSSCESPR